MAELTSGSLPRAKSDLEIAAELELTYQTVASINEALKVLALGGIVPTLALEKYLGTLEFPMVMQFPPVAAEG